MDRGKKGSPDPGGSKNSARTFLKVSGPSCDHRQDDRFSDGEDTGERNFGLKISSLLVGDTSGSNPVESSSVRGRKSEKSTTVQPSVSMECVSRNIAIEKDVFLQPGGTKIEAQALRPTASGSRSSVMGPSNSNVVPVTESSTPALHPRKFLSKSMEDLHVNFDCKVSPSVPPMDSETNWPVLKIPLRPVEKTPRADCKLFGLIPSKGKKSEAFIYQETGVAKSKMAANVNSHRETSPETSPVIRSISDRFSSNFLQEAKNTGHGEGPTEISASQVQSISGAKHIPGSEKSKMATNVNSHRETSPRLRIQATRKVPEKISALQVQSISSTKQNSGSEKSKMAANGYSHREPSFTNSTVSDGFSSNFVQENEDTVCKKVPICTDETSVDPPTPAAQPSSTEALEMEVSPNPVALDQISYHDVHTGSSGGLYTS
uniref:Uncharacterized protein n=1 Tax=Xenopus tropicalis TaxID=8364 RepID=A0A1B8XTG5_XENTR